MVSFNYTMQILMDAYTHMHHSIIHSEGGQAWSGSEAEMSLLQLKNHTDTTKAKSVFKLASTASACPQRRINRLRSRQSADWEYFQTSRRFSCFDFLLTKACFQWDYDNRKVSGEQQKKPHKHIQTHSKKHHRAITFTAWKMLRFKLQIEKNYWRWEYCKTDDSPGPRQDGNEWSHHVMSWDTRKVEVKRRDSVSGKFPQNSSNVNVFSTSQGTIQSAGDTDERGKRASRQTSLLKRFTTSDQATIGYGPFVSRPIKLHSSTEKHYKTHW